MNTRQIVQALFLIVLLWCCQHDPLEGPPGSDPNNGGGGGGGAPELCDPDSIYFQQSVLLLIVSSCAIPGCHDPGAAEDDVILNNYNNIINTGDVDPFDLNGSDLYDVITEDDPDKLMPPPDEFPSLTEDEIAIIRNWILQGALNNSCESASCDTTNVNFSSSIEPIFSAKCTGCHSGDTPQGGISLTNYAEISSESLFGDVLAAVQHQEGVTNMPFNSPQLPQCEIELIRIWIENGAPE